MGLLNTACSLPASNENFLFDTNRYLEEFVKLKNNQPQGVVFAAVVGVPRDEDVYGDSPCQWSGDLLVTTWMDPRLRGDDKISSKIQETFVNSPLRYRVNTSRTASLAFMVSVSSPWGRVRVPAL